ncbi:MAG: HdeA family protein [Magnetococcus sp. DMHC-8]
MKKSTSVLLFLCASLLLAAPAQARKQSQSQINFGTYTCGAFLADAAQGSEEDIGIVLMWLDGYLSGVSGDTVWKQKDFEEFSERLANYCATHGNAKLLEAARKKGIQQ